MAGKRSRISSSPAPPPLRLQHRLRRSSNSVVDAGVSEANIRIGIGGWTYPPWRGVFYPEKLPQSKELEYASGALTAIEINATFYGRQKPKSWETWQKTVPDGFQFAVKGSRYCVMRSRLSEGAEGIGNFFAQGFAALRPKLGP